MRTRVYVDGLNLYYAALRGTPYKWLDLYALFQDHVLAPGTVVDRVLYYTAPVKGSSSDDPESPLRQQRYLRALLAYRPGRVEIRHGFILRSTPLLRLAEPVAPERSMVKVLHFTEKQTDVNLAVDVISDAWKGHFDQAVVCSNDSDLAGALAALRRDHPNLILGLVSPVRASRQISSELRKWSHWHKTLSAAHLAAAQLPDKIPGTPLSRPDAWKPQLG